MSTRPGKLLELIREFEYGDRSGGQGRPDDSGVRGGLRRPRMSRGSDYPYDEDNPDQMYGQPRAYDRGSGGAGASHAPMTPSRSAWEELGEIMGSPILLTKAYQGGQIGNATGIPGADGDWANAPVKPWDRKKVDDDDLERYGEGYLDMTFDPAVPQPEPVPNSKTPNFHDQTDDSIETKIDRIWGRGNNPSSAGGMGRMVPSPTIFIVGTPGPHAQGIGQAFRTSRGLYGLIPKESAWAQLEKMLSDKS